MAEFMGDAPIGFYDTLEQGYTQIPYDTSWDYLMPVVTKVNELNSRIFTKPILLAHIHQCIEETNIKEAFNSIIKYIIRYNEHNIKIARLWKE